MSLQSRLWFVGGQIATCDSKCTFPTMGKALWFANRRGFPMKAYRCPVCDGWHLTTK